MSCDCKTEIEDLMVKRFQERNADATNVKVSLDGYALAFGKNITLAGYMPMKIKADMPLKKGGTKEKTTTHTMAFSYCPFCGVKVNQTLA